MKDRTRIAIAGGVTALFLAAISAVGLAVQSEPPASAPSPAAAKSTPATPAPAAATAVAPAAPQVWEDHDEGEEAWDD